MIKGAGVLFLTSDNQALFLKRGNGGDFPGTWCLPGGHIEDGETPAQAAMREATEECGFDWPKDYVASDILARTKTPKVSPTVAISAPVENAPISETIAAPQASEPEFIDFTTFLERVDGQFLPKLNDEHVGYAWAPVMDPPQPLHPGVDIAARRLFMDELDIAKAIAAGELTSPQQYKNLWLFALRITGTGLAFRAKHDEWVWRKPEVYLNEEFLQRSSGLPVIWVHPPKAVLDSKEFGERVIGTILYPYIKGDEVWGIAKILDDTAAQWMRDNTLSTSPGVVLGNPSSPDVRLKDEDGRTILIEGKPALLDHLAVCGMTESPNGDIEGIPGVWDKMGPLTGVQVDSQIPGVTVVYKRRRSDAFRKLDSSVRFVKLSESVARLR